MINKSLRILFPVLLLVTISTANAQHYVGARAGYGSGYARIYPPEEKESPWGMWSGGFTWKFFTSEKFVGGIEVDLLFIQQGFVRLDQYYPYGDKYDDYDNTLKHKRTVNSIMIPFFWHPHVYMFQQRLRVFLNLGVTLSYNISSKQQWLTSDNVVLEKGKYDFVLNRDNRWGYGLCGGAGLGWAFDRIEVFGEWRYYIGYSDILKNRNKYSDNPLRSPMDGMQVSLGVTYRLGKGGIRSPMSKKAAEKMQRKMLEKELKRYSDND